MSWTPKPDNVKMRRNTGEDFKPHPEGGFAVVCVDVIDLGEQVHVYKGKTKVNPRVALAFVSGERREDGELFVITKEFTNSDYETANLRVLLEQWRGKPYTQEQLDEGDGLPLHLLAGQAGYMTVAHGQSKANPGRTYAGIQSLIPLPKGLTPPVVDKYERAEYWAEKKKEYAEELRKYQAMTQAAQAGAPTEEVLAAMPEALDMGDDDDLPF